MLSNILSTVIVIAVLCGVFSITVGMFNTKLYKAINEEKCSGLEILKAYIPFYNIAYARKLAYGKCTVFNIGFIVCAVLIVFRVAAVILVSTFPILVVYSAFTTYVAILIYAIMYIVNAVDFVRMLNGGFITTLCCVIVAPVGYYMLSNIVIAYFKSVEDKVSGTFEA